MDSPESARIRGMSFDAAALPDDPQELRAFALSMAEERDALKTANDEMAAANGDLRTTNGELEAANKRLEALLDQFKRLLFGPRSEKMPPDQLELGLEDTEQAISETETGLEQSETVRTFQRRRKGARPSLPKHLPEVERLIDVPEAEKTCPCCDSERHVIGEDLIPPARRNDLGDHFIARR